MLHTLTLIRVLKPKYWFLENPASGLLKTQSFMRDLPYADVTYCRYAPDWGYPVPQSDPDLDQRGRLDSKADLRQGLRRYGQERVRLEAPMHCATWTELSGRQILEPIRTLQGPSGFDTGNPGSNHCVLRLLILVGTSLSGRARFRAI